MGRQARINSSLESINKRLGDYFGRDSVTSQDIHRIVDATNLTEPRRSDYTVETEGGIFLRDEYALVKEVLRYPNYQNRHVFEMLVPIPEELRNELVTPEQRIYECFYVFQYDNKPLPVTWKAVEMIMQFKLYGKRERLTDFDIEEQRRKDDIKHIKYFTEVLKDQSSIIAPHSGVKGIFVPTNYEKKRYSSGLIMDASSYNNTEKSVVVANV